MGPKERTFIRGQKLMIEFAFFNIDRWLTGIPS